MFRLVRLSARDVSLCTIDSSTRNAKIGRDPKTCTVQLGTKAVAVSREHADLQWTNSGVTLSDTSSFGTLVDGVKIVKSSKLLIGGERLKIGQEEFILEKIDSQKVSSESSLKKPVVKNSITSYFKKNTIFQEESQLAEKSIRNILASETPSESQESQKTISHRQSKIKPTRGGPRRTNPLFDFDEEDDILLDNIQVRKVLAAETPDSVPPERVAHPPPPPSALPSVPTTVSPFAALHQTVSPSACTQRTSPTVPSSTSSVKPATEKRKKVSLFAKPSQRQRKQIPVVLEDNDADDVIELNNAGSPLNGGSTSQIDDGFARPSLPQTRSRTTLNHSAVASSTMRGVANRTETSKRLPSDDMDVNTSFIPTQVIPPVRKPINRNGKDTRGPVSNEPPRKKTKSLFAEHFKRQKRLENSKPREKSLLDEDDNGVLNIRYDYVPPKPVIGERAYSSIENLRIMEQMGRDAKARWEKKYGTTDVESQYPSVEELSSILCSSHSEKKKKGKGKDENLEDSKEVKEVERVGNETLDEEIKSQLVTFCDSLIVSQPCDESMASVNPSQGKGFKKFKKARQGRFATQSAVFAGIIGGSDLVDFRQIQH